MCIRDRNVLGLEDCNTTEIKPTAANKIIDLMDEQKAVSDLGAPMRLGAYAVSYTHLDVYKRQVESLLLLL